MADISYKELVSKIFRTWPYYIVKATVFTDESPHPRDLKIKGKGEK